MEWRYYGVRLTGLKKTGLHSPEKFVQRVANAIQKRRCASKCPRFGVARCSGETHTFSCTSGGPR